MPVLSSRECERHYWSTLETPSTTTGTRYLCTEEELYELLHAHEMADRFRNKRDKFVSLGKATWDLEHFLQRHPSDRQRAALKRLRAAARDPTWTTDVFIKAFHDLDLVFFDSTMKGRVRLLWKGSDEGLTTSLGNQHYKMLGCTRIMLQHPVIIVEIVLNAQSLFFGMLPTCDIRAQIWRTLLHEMVHAYLVLKNGEGVDRDEESIGLDGSHGRHFQRCARAVDARAKREMGVEIGFKGQGLSKRGGGRG